MPASAGFEVYMYDVTDFLHRLDHLHHVNPNQLLSDRLPDLLYGFVKKEASGSSLEDVVEHHFRGVGKLLRGKLVISVSTFAKCDRSDTIKIAMATELLHNASLVHDDICDRDDLRRGNACVWKAFGSETALCFGDWLIGLSFKLIASLDHPSAGAGISSLLAETLCALSKGQAREFATKPVDNWSEYLEIVRQKTSPLITFPVVAPLTLGNLQEEISIAKRAITELGVAYQIANDIEGVLGDDGHENPLGDLRRSAPNAVMIANVERTNTHFHNSGHRPQGHDSIPYCLQKIDGNISTATADLEQLPADLQAAIDPLVRYLKHSIRMRTTVAQRRYA